MAKSTKSALLFLLVAISILGLIGYLKTSKPSAKAESRGSSNTEVTTSVKGKLYEQARQHPGLKIAQLSEDEKSGPCRTVLESIETMPLKTLMYDLENGTLKLDPSCVDNLKASNPLLKNISESCAKLVDGKPSIECTQKLFFFKAVRINNATKNQPKDSLATEILIQKLMASLKENGIGSPDGQKELREIGEKIYERLPDSDSAVKAALLGYLADDKLSPADRERFSNLTKEAREKFPDDWNIYEIDLFRKRSESEDAFNKTIQSFYAANPRSAIGQYYMGCINWSNKDEVTARSFFQAALQAAPNDPRFKLTYENSLNHHPPEKVCSMQLTFDPDKF